MSYKCSGDLQNIQADTIFRAKTTLILNFSWFVDRLNANGQLKTKKSSLFSGMI